MKKVYLMCPVRNATEEQKKQLDEYVENLENNGYKVHYPPRDVDQEQEGLSILSKHRCAMFHCDEVHIWWDKDSKGSYFDLGMAFMLSYYKYDDLRFVIANDIEKTEYKSFENVILKLQEMIEARISSSQEFMEHEDAKIIRCLTGMMENQSDETEAEYEPHM